MRVQSRWEKFEAWGSTVTSAVMALALAAGCGAVSPDPAVLFLVPLSVEGRPVGDAILDTGGAYEVMLREAFGLEIVDSAEVLAFAGRQLVSVTEGFTYRAGSIEVRAAGAILSGPICDCNGLGFPFFRKTGLVLALDFPNRSAAFVFQTPEDGIVLEFASPPGHLPEFDSAFLEVEIEAGGAQQAARALLDTGALVTSVHRAFLSATTFPPAQRARVRLSHPWLGTVETTASVFDDPRLPDVILGTEVMATWADRWYFRYDPAGGRVVVQHEPGDQGDEAPALSLSRSEPRVSVRAE